MNAPHDPSAVDLSSNRFVVAARPISGIDNIALPRFGNSVPEDALAHAANTGSSAALRRLMERFSGFRFDLAAVTTDDNRFAIFDRSMPEDEVEAAPEDLDSIAVSRDLTRTFGCPVEITHLSGPAAMSWWPHDMVVVQERTPSSWQVNAPSELSAMPGYTLNTPGESDVWKGVLEPDQAMFVPRGWPLSLVSAEVPADCTIFVLRRWTGIDILAQLPFAAGHWPLLRADAPVDIAAQTESYDGHLYKENHFGDLLAELASIEQVDSSLARLQASVTEHEPQTVRADDLVVTEPIRLVGPTGTKWISHDDDRCTVAVSGWAIDVVMDALPAFAEISTGEPFRIADLPLSGSADGSFSLVAELCDLNLVAWA